MNTLLSGQLFCTEPEATCPHEYPLANLQNIHDSLQSDTVTKLQSLANKANLEHSHKNYHTTLSALATRHNKYRGISKVGITFYFPTGIVTQVLLLF